MSRLSPPFSSAFSVYRLGAQGPYPAGLFIPPQWTNKVFDRLNEVQIVAPWRFTPKEAGYYWLCANAQWNVTLANEIHTVCFQVNLLPPVAMSRVESSDTLETFAPTSATLYLTPNDYVRVITFWSSLAGAGNRNLVGLPECTYFMGYRIG